MVPLGSGRRPPATIGCEVRSGRVRSGLGAVRHGLRCGRSAHAVRVGAGPLVTVERIDDTDYLSDDTMAPGTIPSLYITALAVAPRGAHPIGLPGDYSADADALPAYVEAAKSQEGFDRWADAEIFDKVPA